MKKVERIISITNKLINNPSVSFSISELAEEYDCAKSSMSEDIKTIKDTFLEDKIGFIETTIGSKGGIKFIPTISKEEASKVLNDLCTKLSEKSRLLGSGFIYTSDIMFSSHLTQCLGRIFAQLFVDSEADMVVTVETKGIGVAMHVAHLLNLPLAVIRHESKVSEGSTISINYFSGSTERIKQMSISKKGIKKGCKALIIDDFMRGGGSIKGIDDMLKEFDSTSVGVGVVIVAGGMENKKLSHFTPLVVLNDHTDTYEIKPNLTIIDKLPL